MFVYINYECICIYIVLLFEIYFLFGYFGIFFFYDFFFFSEIEMDIDKDKYIL